MRAPANGIELEYETFGDPEGPALLLVHGLGAQMISWPAPLCESFADRGFHVVRFDNRDIGLSTKCDRDDHDVMTAMMAALSGGVLLVAADTIVPTVVAPSVVPVGIVVAMLGAPVFIYRTMTRRAAK